MAKTESKPQETEEKELSCRWNVEHEYREIRIIADCKSCTGKGDLDESSCLKGILDAVSSETNADVVILSHFIERQYFGHSMELIKRMAQVMRQMSQLSMRDPYNEYFQASKEMTASQKSQQKGTCERCIRNPQLLFPELKKIFTTDIQEFYKDLFRAGKKMDKGPTSFCGPCLENTQSDIVFLFNKLEELRAFIFYRGYNIVI